MRSDPGRNPESETNMHDPGLGVLIALTALCPGAACSVRPPRRGSTCPAERGPEQMPRGGLVPHQACAGMAGLGATLGFAGSLSPPPGTSPGGAASPEELAQGSSPFSGRLCQAPASTLLPGIWCREGCPACPGRSPRQSPFPRGRPLLPTDPPRPAVKPAPVFPIVG